MTSPRKRVVISIVIGIAAFAAGPACRADQSDRTETAAAGGEEQNMTTAPQHRIVIEADRDEVEGWRKIRTVEVKPGEVVEFNVVEAMAWVLLPDPHFEHVDGKGTWTAGESFVAFEVGPDGTRVRVAEDYPNEDRRFHYAVMVTRNEAWAYVHGSNPPPGMIIRGQR